METIDSLILVAHIVCGAALFMTTIIMQLVMTNVMKRVPMSDGKMAAQNFIKTRWKPVVNGVIIVMTLSAFYLLSTRWYMISVTPLLHAKIFFGGLTLLLANLLHFYWPGKKRRLEKRGETAAVIRLSARTAIYEKVVLVGAATTFLLGVIFNHF